MDAAVVVAILQTAKATMEFIQAQQQGNSAVAAAAMNGVIPAGANEDLVELIQLGQTALGYLAKRGLSVSTAVGMIENAQAEGRDLTTAEVEQMLSQLQSELDTTQTMIDQMED